mgnify:CR=1 FL=1
MNNTAGLIALFGGLVLAFNNASSKTARLSVEQVKQLAEQTVRENGWSRVDPLMLRTMTEIESSRNPQAVRVEKHLNDASIGLMQTLLGTAEWLYADMGATRFGKPTKESLMRPEVSMYFGGAMVNWLSNYRGRPRGEEWVVMSYNGGPGANNGQTNNHWRKYQEAKGRLVAHDTTEKGA